MCKLLGVTRSLVYYKRKNKQIDVGLEKIKMQSLYIKHLEK